MIRRGDGVGQLGRDLGAGRIACQHDAVGIDVQCLGVRLQVGQRRVDLARGRGPGGAGGDAVVHVGHHEPARGEDLQVVGHVLPPAGHETPAMHPHHGGQSFVAALHVRRVIHVQQRVGIGRVVTHCSAFRHPRGQVLAQRLTGFRRAPVEHPADQQHRGPGTQLERRPCADTQHAQRQCHAQCPAAHLSPASFSRRHVRPRRPFAGADGAPLRAGYKGQTRKSHRAGASPGGLGSHAGLSPARTALSGRCRPRACPGRCPGCAACAWPRWRRTPDTRSTPRRR